MRVIQLLPSIQFGDAVSNDTRAIGRILAELGYETEIFAEHIDGRLPAGTARHVSQIPELGKKDLLIYHASTGSEINFNLPRMGGRKVMIYHNITPAVYFRGYNAEAEHSVEYGYDGIRFLADKLDYCIADSEYNRQQLLEMGYSCPVDVCPILIPFEDYDKAPDPQVLDRYRGDGMTNLLFVGRLAANKCQQDIIRAFYCYQKHFNPNSRLFLVGNAGIMGKYEAQLRAYARLLGIGDRVIFTGHIKFNAILAYYRLADVFVCMSEHEGFCVPLLEAMHFDVPIVAYASTAVPGTLGGGGLLLKEKDPCLAAAAIDRAVGDEALRAYLSAQQKQVLAEYRYEAVRARFIACLERALKL